MKRVKPPKRKDPVPCIEVKRIWRDDAVIHPDGTREGAWVECQVYQAESVPETREGYVTSKPTPQLTQEGVESFADLYHRFMEQEVLRGRGIERPAEKDVTDE